MSGFRVIMTVTESVSPELFAALHEVPARLRAERVRMLATLGVVAGTAFAARAIELHKPSSQPDPHETGAKKQDRAIGIARGIGGL